MRDGKCGAVICCRPAAVRMSNCWRAGHLPQSKPRLRNSGRGDANRAVFIRPKPLKQMEICDNYKHFHQWTWIDQIKPTLHPSYFVKKMWNLGKQWPLVVKTAVELKKSKILKNTSLDMKPDIYIHSKNSRIIALFQFRSYAWRFLLL